MKSGVRTDTTNERVSELAGVDLEGLQCRHYLVVKESFPRLAHAMGEAASSRRRPMYLNELI